MYRSKTFTIHKGAERLATLRRNAMKSTTFLTSLLCGWLALTSPCSAQDLTKPQQQVLTKGLSWLAKAQHKAALGGQCGKYTVAMTAFAGMALLAEGSTFRGAFSDELAKLSSGLIARGKTRLGRRGLHVPPWLCLVVPGERAEALCPEERASCKPQDVKERLCKEDGQYPQGPAYV